MVGELGAIGTIHQTYLDDDGLDPLIDACIMGVDQSTRAALTEADLKDLRTVQESAASERPKIAEQDAEILRTLDQFAKDEAKNADLEAQERALTREKKGEAVEKEKTKLKTQREVLEPQIKSARTRVEELKRQRAHLIDSSGVEFANALLLTGSPFGAFCLTGALSESSKFMNLRMRQKRQLRGAEPTDAFLDAQRLEFCKSLLAADEKTVKPEAKAALLPSCAKVLEPRRRAEN